jgi:hypothetical protein
MILRVCVSLLFAGLLGCVGLWAKVPDAREAQERMLRNFRFESFTLSGRMRTEKQSYPLIMVTERDRVTYHFPEHGVHVRVEFSGAGNVVWTGESPDGPWKLLPRSRYGERILGSDASYEDLSLDFIHWEEVAVLGQDSIKTVPAYAYEAIAPRNAGGYHRIRYWVGSETFALLRADAYNANNQVVKRLEINGVIRLGEAMTIKELQISTLIPGRDLSASRTYIEIRKAERRSAS